MKQTPSNGPRPATRGASGFSLIEILTSMAVGIIIITAFLPTFIQHTNVFATQSELAEQQQNLKLAAEIVVQEIRMAGYNPSEEADAGIVQATGSIFRFTADMNGDGDLLDASEDIAYRLLDADSDGDFDLVRVSTNNQVVAHDIAALQFSYILDDGTETATPADPGAIRQVKITLTTYGDQNHTRTASESTQLRNLEYAQEAA